MTPLDLLDVGLPQTFNLLKKKKKAVSAKYNEVKHSKMKCTCIYTSSKPSVFLQILQLVEHDRTQ